MESLNAHKDAGSGVPLAALLYWLLLFSFVISYVISRNSISLVLTADRLTDAFGMTVALASQRIVKRPPTGRFTYGFHRFESLSSTAMIVVFIILLVFSGYLSYVQLGSSRFPDPVPTIIVSAISLGVLPVITYLLHDDRNLTSQTMSVHTIQDIITSAMALVASTVLLFFNNGDIGFAFSVLIIAVSFYLNRNLILRNMRLLMEGTDLNAYEIEQALKKEFPMVHHLHIWDVCRHYRLATVHIYADKDKRLGELDDMRQKLDEYLSAKGINHLTVQFEPMPNPN